MMRNNPSGYRVELARRLAAQGTVAVVLLLATPGSVTEAETAEKAVGADEAARAILDAAGIQGGLIVHLGCGDGTLTAALRAGDGYLVHGLDADPANVERARRQIQSLGAYGPVSVDAFDGRRLPYADNLVNLLVTENARDVPRDEVLRVLAPRGAACVKEAGQWVKIVKPWPDGIDEWTHFLHDATGNAVAHDRVVAAPQRLQWIDGPLWSRSHEYDSSLSAMVSSQGRLFSIFDEGPTGIIDPRIPDRWSLIARDAFNGVVLWKRPMPDWGWKAWKRTKMEQLDWSRMPSQRLALPLALPRRLVAAGDRVYVTLGYQAPLTALDAATGRTLTTYANTERTDEILHHGARLVLCLREMAENTEVQAKRRGQKPDETERPATLMALEAATGRRLWQSEPVSVVSLSLAASGENVFYHDRAGVVCLDAASGRQRWRASVAAGGGSLWQTDTTLVVHGQVVLCLNRKQLVALSAAEGKTLWKLPGAGGFGVGNPPDLFVADELVWFGQGRGEPTSLTGYDLLTGAPGRTLDLGAVLTRGHHARCYRSKATDNYLLLPKRAVEFIDLDGQQHSRHNWVRGACRYGMLPCNGLLYSTPHPCFCFAGVKLGGFLALSSQPASLPAEAEEPRLVPGPAYPTLNNAQRRETGTGTLDLVHGRDPARNVREPVPVSRQPLRETGTGTLDLAHGRDLAHNIREPVPVSGAGADDWTMHRHDPRRSGSTPTKVDSPVRPVWKARLGGKLTQPVVVGDRLYVARVDACQVCCLDARTGQPTWDYTVGARIDSAPTWYQGRLLFGSADGCVYCLRASDGALAWRLHAAPDDRRVVAFGQVESAWPIHGSVLILNDVAYFVVGRSSFLDGGMIIYGIDPLTGKKRYEARLDGPHPDTRALDENAYAMEGAKSDLLVTDGTLLYLFHNAFNARLEKQPTPVLGKPGVRNLGERRFGEHLFSNAGFLDDSWFSRNHWMLGDHWTAFNFAHQAPKAGELLVFDDTHTYAVKCFVRRNLLSPLFFPATDGYFLVADRNATRPVLVNARERSDYLTWLPQTGELQTCWNLDVGFARGEPAQWVTNVPVRMRALVRTAGALFAAGTPDLCEPDDPSAALEGRKGAVLMTFDPGDGRKLDECKLDAAPVFDGMSAAGGRLYLVTLDGDVRCLGAAASPRETK